MLVTKQERAQHMLRISLMYPQGGARRSRVFAVRLFLAD